MSANRQDLSDNDVGWYLDEIKDSTPLSSEEEARLAKKIRSGDSQAKNKLVSANLKFGVSVAMGYRRLGLPLGDLISAASMGLFIAADKFDETKGFRFITYAVSWIRQQILLMFAEHGRTVRRPLNKVDLIREIYRFKDSKLNWTGQSPTEAEIAEGLNESLKLIRETLATSQPEASLDAYVDDDGERTFHELFPDTEQPSPEELYRRTVLRPKLDQALAQLKPREAKIVRLYFGLDDDNPLTLQEIGDLLGYTRERVRQIKEQALRKLRHPTRAEPLRDRSREYNELFLSAARG